MGRKLKTPFAHLLPPLSSDEFAALKADIKANGVRHSVVTDEDGNILDGHHRYKSDSKCPVSVVEGLTDAEKEAFVFRANFTRRNLSPDQKREARTRMQATVKKLRKNDAKHWTQKRIAEALGVSQQCVAKWFTNNTTSGNTSKPKPDARVKLTPAAKTAALEAVGQGKSQEQVAADFSVSQQTISNIVKHSKKTHARDDDKARKTAHLANSLFDVRRGDFREVLSDVDNVSLILTDPPYPKDSLSLWSDLGKWAAGALAEDGLLVAYSGQMYLPEVLTRLSEHLTYWWVTALIHKGSGNITPLGYPVRKVKNQWKPIVMFYRNDGQGYAETFPDLLDGVGPEKEQHNWQQPVAEAGELIKRYSKKNELVVDPFAGSGGFCLAASQLGRKAIGAEILNG